MSDLVFPKPSPDKARYESIMERGFSRFPERKENYDRYKVASKGEHLDYLPIKIDVENVSRCNLKCEMCQVLDYPNNKRARDMELDEFKALIDEQYGLIEVKIQGMGEPFLGKDFIPMVEYAASKDIWTRTSTNASFLDKNENYKKVVDAGIGEIQISVDGTTKETYEKIRVNAGYEKMVENCRLINGYCDETGLDVTRMWVLLQDSNLHELELFPSFAKSLGFKRIAIIMDVQGWGDDVWTEKNNEKKVSSLISQEQIDQMLQEANKLGVTLGFWDISSKYNSNNLCPWPFERTYISSEGRVVPCCMIANPDRSELGKLGRLNKVWNSDAYKEFRKAHLEGMIPDVCRFCYKNENV